MAATTKRKRKEDEKKTTKQEFRWVYDASDFSYYTGSRRKRGGSIETTYHRQDSVKRDDIHKGEVYMFGGGFLAPFPARVIRIDRTPRTGNLKTVHVVVLKQPMFCSHLERGTITKGDFCVCAKLLPRTKENESYIGYKYSEYTTYTAEPEPTVGIHLEYMSNEQLKEYMDQKQMEKDEKEKQKSKKKQKI